MMHKPVPTSYRDWHGYEEDFMFLLNGYTWSFRVYENALAPSGMLSYAICNVFLLMDNQRGILSYQIRQLPCHARGARAHNLFSHLPFHMDSFVCGNVSFR